MNAVLALLAFAGCILKTQAVCNLSACTAGSDCAGVQTYLKCLSSEASGCSGAQAALKTAIDTAVSTSNSMLTTLNCGTSSGGGGSTAVCSIGVCTTTGSTDCTERNKYYDCLVKQRDSCTSSQTTEKTALETAASAELTAKEALGCGGAGSVTISIFTLILSFIAIYIKM